MSLVRLGFEGGFHRVWRPYIGFPVPQGLRPPRAIPISCVQLRRQGSRRSLRALALGLPPPRPSGLTACQRGRHSALGDTRAPSRGRKANWRICLTTTKRLTWYVFSSSNTYMSQLWLIHSSKLKSKPSSVVHPFLTVQTAPPPFLVPSPPWVRAGAGPEEPWGLAGALPWWLLPRPGTRPGVQAMTRRVRREAGWVCRKMSTAERGGGGPQRPPVHTPHRAA